MRNGNVAMQDLTPLLRKENQQPFSVVNELIKWTKLKEDGYITEEKYN